MREEQVMILRMLQEHTVSREDAVRLLAAIGAGRTEDAEVQAVLELVENGTLSPEAAADRLNPDAAAPEPMVDSGGKWFRIRVQKNGKGPVNIRLPLSLISVGLKMFGNSSFKVGGVPIDTQQLWAAIRNSNVGNIIEIVGDDGERVEIAVE